LAFRNFRIGSLAVSVTATCGGLQFAHVDPNAWMAVINSQPAKKHATQIGHHDFSQRLISVNSKWQCEDQP